MLQNEMMKVQVAALGSKQEGLRELADTKILAIGEKQDEATKTWAHVISTRANDARMLQGLNRRTSHLVGSRGKAILPMRWLLKDQD